VLQFVHGIGAELAELAQEAEMALQLFLTAAHCASEEAHLEMIAYEFFEQVGDLFFSRHQTERLLAALGRLALGAWLAHAQGLRMVVPGDAQRFPCILRQAFILYEEAIPDSRGEVTALQSIVGTLQRCHIFTADNRGALVHKATGYSAKLLKRADQCRAVCACSHLFWQDDSKVHCGLICLHSI
jgi:Vacuolar protein sorting-associated protein 35